MSGNEKGLSERFTQAFFINSVVGISDESLKLKEGVKALKKL